MVNRAVLWSVLDQAFAALGLYAFTIIVSRELGLIEFGRFSVFLALVSIVGALLQPLLVDSSTILSSREQQKSTSWVDLSQLVGIILLLLSSAVMFVLWAIDVCEPAVVVSVLVVSEVAVSLLSLIRRSAYVDERYTKAAFASAFSCVLTVTALSFLNFDSPDGLLVAALARVGINTAVVVVLLFPKLVVKEFWFPESFLTRVVNIAGFSREYIASGLIFWITNSLQIVLVGSFLTLSDAAGFRAAQLLTMPSLQIQSALFQLLLPQTIRSFQLGQDHKRTAVLKAARYMILPTLIYSLFLFFVVDALLFHVFDSEYVVFSTVVVIFALITVVDSIKQVIVMIAYSEDKKQLFIRYRVVGLCLFSIGIVPAVLSGKLLGFAAMSLVINTLMLLYLWRAWSASRRGVNEF